MSAVNKVNEKVVSFIGGSIWSKRIELSKQNIILLKFSIETFRQ